MDTLTAITTRTSVRKYTDEAISEESIKAVLNAGFCAPSAHNFRPWDFVVLRERETLAAIGEESKYAKMMPDAPCAIVVCGDSEKQHFPELLHQDCAAAIENMLLAAHALGLGAVWCGVMQGDAWTLGIARRLQLPEKILPVGIVVMGHPAMTRTPKERYEENKIHFEKW